MQDDLSSQDFDGLVADNAQAYVEHYAPVTIALDSELATRIEQLTQTANSALTKTDYPVAVWAGGKAPLVSPSRNALPTNGPSSGQLRPGETRFRLPE